MKVLFSNPPWWDCVFGEPPDDVWRAGCRAGSRWPWTYVGRSKPDKFRFGDYLPYPYFMGYAMTYAARETGADVRFRDSIALKESYERYFQHLRHERYDYVFIESATPSWEADETVIRGIRKLCPETKTVVTGPIAAAKGSEILENLPVHACVQGEYEKGSVRVINGESGLIEHDLLTKEEMNAAPYPYYDATYAKRYWDPCPPGQHRPHAQVWSSRGCPYKCIFCVWPATMTSNDPDGTHRRTVRQYTPAYMEGFLSEIVARYHYKTIYFDDDTFNLGDRHTLGMCEVMQGIDVPWTAMCRADTIKLDTWRVMAESGCLGVKIGFESGNQWVVDNIVKKRLDLEKAREVVHEIKRLGMTVHGTFTFGLPGETVEQMADTVAFSKSLPLDTSQQSGTAVIEGTPLSTLLERGHLEKYSGAKVDAGFNACSDGEKKMREIVERFNQGEVA